MKRGVGELPNPRVLLIAFKIIFTWSLEWTLHPVINYYLFMVEWYADERVANRPKNFLSDQVNFIQICVTWFLQP
jgi:hypothetical protein